MRARRRPRRAASRTGSPVERVLLIGGGAALGGGARGSRPTVLGAPVDVPPPGEYVADGAARQAAWVLSGADAPPGVEAAGGPALRRRPRAGVRARYAEGRSRHLDKTS